jgi:hypothetical protein
LPYKKYTTTKFLEHVAQKYGKFGDRWCDALRRGLGVPMPKKTSAKVRNAGLEQHGRNRLAEVRLDRKTTDREIAFRFGDGPWKTLKLPSDKKNTQEVRRVREEALDFGRANGATDGQLNAIGKAFSDAGYYLNRKERPTSANADFL